MDIPRLTAFATKDGNLKKLETGLFVLQSGLKNQHIWNADFVEAKDSVTRICENAMNHEGSAWMKSMPREAWQGRYTPEDIRWNVYYTPALNNAPGAYRKLLKYLGTEGAEFDAAIEMIGEAAQVAELIKSLKPFIVKGRKPTVLTDAQREQQEADLKNTGICPVCMRRQKLTFDSKLVAHGYTIPRGWGGRNGMCMGHGYKAWELSPEGAIAFKSTMESYLSDFQRLLVNLQSSNSPTLSEMVRVRKPRVVNGVTNLYENERRTYEKGTPEYERVRQIEIANTENSIRHISGDIEMIGTRIDSWKAEPLMYGGAETQERWKSKMLKKEE